MTTNNHKFNILASLPLEILKQVLDFIGFDSITILLESFPKLKKHTIIISPEDERRLNHFVVEGVQTFPTYQECLAKEPGIKGRTIILVLCNLSALHYSWHRVDGKVKVEETRPRLCPFSDVIFERLANSASTIATYVEHNICSFDSRPFLSRNQKFRMIKQGVKYRERVYGGSSGEDTTEYDVQSFQKLLPTHTDQKVLNRKFFRDENPIRLVMDHKQTVYGRVQCQALKILHITFPKLKQGEQQILSHIKAPNLREFIVYYHRTLAKFVDMRLGYKEGHDVPAHFGLLHLDSELYDEISTQNPKPTSRPIGTGEFCFTREFNTFDISGCDARDVLYALDLTRAVSLEVVENGSALKDHQEETSPPVITAPFLEAFSFSTNIKCAEVPEMDAPELVRVSLCSTASTLTVSWKG